MSQPTFTVSAGAIVLNPKNQVLLLHHILRPGSGWGIPGGFLDRGEQPDTAVRREIREETGIELTDLRFLRINTVDRHIEVVFAARSGGDPRVLSKEITQAAWFSPDALPEGLTHAHRELIRSVLDELS